MTLVFESDSKKMPTEFQKLLDSVCFKHYYYGQKKKKKTDSCEVKWGTFRNDLPFASILLILSSIHLFFTNKEELICTKYIAINYKGM